MPKYLIEGSCDGGLFGETIEANSQADAEAFAIERLCEAWGEEYGPDTTLDDLGDCAMVTEYTADDYARDAAPAMLALLREVASITTDDEGDVILFADENGGNDLALRIGEIVSALSDVPDVSAPTPATPEPAQMEFWMATIWTADGLEWSQALHCDCTAEEAHGQALDWAREEGFSDALLGKIAVHGPFFYPLPAEGEG